MAKLKAPLFSLGASGQLGKALVFFGWKGLDVVREYVVPSNPKTTGQTTQRGYLTAAVAMIHVAMASATAPLAELDKIAYALWAGVVQSATTWFNQAVRMWADQKVAGRIPVIFGSGSVVAGNTTLTFGLIHYRESGAVTAGRIYYGTSRTALVSSIACTIAELAGGKAVPGLTNGTKYFLQFRCTTPATFEHSDSGIYHGTPSA